MTWAVAVVLAAAYGGLIVHATRRGARAGGPQPPVGPARPRVTLRVVPYDWAARGE